MTYPVMLPIMVFSFGYYFMAFINFLSSLQNIVEEIWLDKSGTEVRILYRNKAYRKFRGVQTEEKILNSAFISSQGTAKSKQFLKNLLIENIFPEKFPIDESEFVGFGTFWRKYFYSRKSFLFIAKR